MIDPVLSRTPAQPVFMWRAARRLTVLAYHGVDDATRFAAQLDHLRRTTAVVSLEEVLDALAGRSALPRRAVLLTFDDGARTVLDVGLPLLRERGLPGAAYVVTDLLDTEQPFWWREVEALVASGGRSTTAGADGDGRAVVDALKRAPDTTRWAAIEELRRSAPVPAPPQPQLRSDELQAAVSAGLAIGNHTASHPSLPRCDDATVADEIGRAHRHLTDALGAPPPTFAYPYGHHDPRAAQVLRDLGYEAAFLFDHRVSPTRPADPLRISRVRVNSTTPLARFKILVSGLHPALHRLRGGV